MNRISDEKDKAIRELLAQGKSIRVVAREVGVSPKTVFSRRARKEVPPGKKSGWDLCDHCGKKLENKKEFHRRTRRTNHKFCSQDCYAAFRRGQADEDQCVMCGVKRRDLRDRVLIKDRCPKCYEIAKRYGFDEEAAAIHFITRDLRKEINHVEREQWKRERH